MRDCIVQHYHFSTVKKILFSVQFVQFPRADCVPQPYEEKVASHLQP